MSLESLSPIQLDALRTRLQGGEPFLELARSFIQTAAQETSDEGGFREFFRNAMTAIATENASEVDELAGSPIEKIFLNSLLLSFVKNDGLGLLVHRTFADAPKEIAEFRATLKNWQEFVAWFREKKPANSIEEFLDRVCAQGGMDQKERDSYIYFIFRYTYVPMDGSFHMTLQPRFPNLKIEGKSIRPDILFWIPSRPDIKVVVECDGFQFHSDKKTFECDRKRDRALKALGYDVFRFSGSEIHKNPVEAPFELAQYLWRRAEKSAS